MKEVGGPPKNGMSFLSNVARFWYFIGAPAEVPATASFAQREAVRRGRVASWILLVVLILDLAPIPGLWGKPTVVATLLANFGVDVLALILNRFGRIRIAGVLTILTIQLGIIGTFLSVPGGTGPLYLPLLDDLLQATVVAAVMFSPAAALILMLINGFLIWLVLHVGTLSPELANLLHTQEFPLILQAWELQVIIGIFLYIITRSANEALKRADRAEEIEKLQRQEIEHQEAQVQHEQILNNAIQQILGTLTRFNNGEWNAKVPVERENVLFQVSYAVNNLLSRLSRSREAEQKLAELQKRYQRLQEYVQNQRNVVPGTTAEKTHQAALQLAQAIKSNRLPAEPTGTAIDEVVTALNAKVKETNRVESSSPQTGLPSSSSSANPSRSLRPFRERKG